MDSRQLCQYRSTSICVPGKHGGAERFCAEVLERTGVLLLPGTLLDHGNEHFRIGFGRRNMPEILKIVENYLLERGTK